MTDAAPSDHLARIRALAPLIAASADETERNRRLAPAVVEALLEGGFYRMLLPKSVGGAELSPLHFMAVLEEVAKADASTAWCLGQCGVCATVASFLDPDTRREIFGSQRAVLAWGPVSMTTPARAVPGGYRLTGRWNFASGSRQATWLGAHVTIAEPDGTIRKRDGMPSIRTLLFPAESARLEDVWHVIGLKGTGTDSYAVDDLFVPERQTLARDNPAECRETALLYRLTPSNIFAMGFGAVALGVARAMLDAAIAGVGGKASSGMKHPMRDNNAVHAQIGRMEAQWRAARAYHFGCVEGMWRDLADAPALSAEQRVALRLSSTWAIHQSAAIADTAYHMMGATAVFSANPFERRFRDLHTIAQQSQARDIHYESVGQILLGLEPEATIFTI